MTYTPSKNDIVNEYLAALDPALAPLFHAVRAAVLKAGPSLNESIKWRNCLVYATTRNLIQTVVGKGKVSLIFFEGAALTDKHGLLEGDGSKTRTLRITSPDFNRTALSDYVKQSLKAGQVTPMRHYRATTTIRATPEAIWKILTDAEGYPRWDQTMNRIEGRLALGETVSFYTKLSERAFPVKVTGFEPGKKLVLTGGMPLGLFKSERTHTLEPAEGGLTRFTTDETFSGLLLPIFGRTIPDLTDNFQGFVAALKQRAET